MNIFQFSFGDGYAGSAKMAVLSSKVLLDKGHNVKLFVSKDSLTKKRAVEKSLPIIEIDSNQKLSAIINAIMNYPGYEKPDFAVAFHSLDRKVVMRLKSKFKKNIISVAYRQNISLSAPLIGSFIYNRYFDFMIACSKGVADSLIRERISNKKIYTIHNTTETPQNISEISGDYIRKRFNIDKKIVLGISSWFHKKRKGFDILFESFSKLDEKFVLLIIGVPEEYQKAVIDYASSFGINPQKIIMPGFVDNIYEYYKAMNIFLLPSRSEGFSLSLLEAAAAGLPIIASDIPGNDEFIKHRQNGLLFDPNIPAELTRCILELTNDRTTACNYGNSAKVSYYRDFSLESYGDKICSFFENAFTLFSSASAL